MTYENFIKAKLLEFAAREAYQYGGTVAMCAVAQVIYNRVQGGWGEWLHVIDTADKYAGTASDGVKLDPKDMTFRRMLMLIDDIYFGTADDSSVNIPTQEGNMKSLYYANLNDLNRPWFRENILSNLNAHPCLATVGPLSFFA